MAKKDKRIYKQGAKSLKGMLEALGPYLPKCDLREVTRAEDWGAPEEVGPNTHKPNPLMPR